MSRGGATAALTQVAATGKFAGKQFEEVARTAARMEAATGQAVDKTISKFAEIASDPVSALLKLNESEHFLRRSQLERIDTLMAEGREQDAANVAIGIYSNHLDEVAKKSQAAMPAMSKWWQGIKGEISGSTSQLQIYIDLLAKAVSLNTKGLPGVDLLKEFATGLLPTTRLRILNEAGKRYLAQNGRPDFSGVTSRVVGDAVVGSDENRRRKAAADAQREWEATEARYSKTKALELEIADIKAKGAAAGKSQAEIDAQVAAANKRFLESAEKASRKRKEALTDEQKAAKQLADSYASAMENLKRQIALFGDTSNLGRVNYDISSGNLNGISADQQAKLREQAAWLDWLKEMDAVNEIQNGIIEDQNKQLLEQSQKKFDSMTEYAKQASRNMQDALADFFFDPFQDGLKGMLESFAETL